MNYSFPKMRGEWYNFAEHKYDAIEAPQADEEAVKYIPQIQAAQGLYHVHRAMGKSILEAMRDVLTACVGEKAQP